MMTVAWLRYLDTFTEVDQTWLIAERQIIVKWSETRPLGSPTAGREGPHRAHRLPIPNGCPSTASATWWPSTFPAMTSMLVC
jgi:hypothetical protein